MKKKKHRKERKMEEKSKNQLFCFQINDTEYAFPIDSVNEVLNNFKMTSIPQASEEVEGVINWRGDIIPIINLGTVLNKKDEEKESDSFVIIVEVNKETIGFLTEKIKNIREIDSKHILPPPHLIKGKKEFLKGVIKVEDDKIVHLLNEENLLGFKASLVTSKEAQDKGLKKDPSSNEDAKYSEEKAEGHLVFELENQLYAFSINDLEKISSTSIVEQNWTNDQNLLKGTTQLNESIVPLVDFKRFLGIKQKESEEKNILFLKKEDETIGLPIDELKQILYLKSDDYSENQSKIILSQQENVDKIANFKEEEKEINNHVFILNKETLFNNIYSKIDSDSLKSSKTEKKESEDKTQGKGKEMEVLIFKSNNNTLGLVLESIEEIIVENNITPMPNALGFVEGIISTRGKIIPIININKRLLLKDNDSNIKNGKIIVAKLSEEFHGILVNNVEGIIKIKDSDLKKMPDILENINRKFFSNVIKLEDQAENIFLIDLKEFLNFEVGINKKVS